MGDWLTIDAGGTAVRGYLAVPEAGSGPGVLVCHAWWGLSDFFTGLCDRLAGEGFVALAADMYNGTVVNTIPDAEAAAGKLTAEHAETVAIAALDALLARPEVTGEQAGTIGFSLGGSWAIHLSAIRPEQVGAVVTFYGAGEGDFSNATASYLGHFSPTDEWEPEEWVRGLETSLTEAGRDVTFHWYDGASHWFMEDNRPDAYDAAAAQLAWQRTVDFLRNTLAGAEA
jgi:carboxymethylenebutenolidase